MNRAAPTPTRKPRQRSSVAARWVLLGLAVSLIAAGFVAVGLYGRYVAYTPIAAHYLVPDPALVVRLDLEKVAIYEPFREHLLPILRAGQTDPRLKPRLERLRQHTRIEVGVDVRELVYSRGQKPAHWVIAVGGLFPKSGVVEGIQRVLEEEGLASHLEADPRRLRFTSGALAAQSNDGVVLFASDLLTLKGALQPVPNDQRLGLSADAPLSLGANGRWLNSDEPSATAPSVTHLAAKLVLGDPHLVILSLEFVDRIPVSRDHVQKWLRKRLSRLVQLPAGPLSLEVSGPKELRAQVPVTGQELDRAAVEFAGALKRAASEGH